MSACNHMHDHTQFQCDIDDVESVSVHYSQLSLTHFRAETNIRKTSDQTTNECPDKKFLRSSSSIGLLSMISVTAIWATHKVYWAGDKTGMGVSSLFRPPATLDRNNSVTVAPVHFLFCYNKPEVESFRSRVRLSKSSQN